MMSAKEELIRLISTAFNKNAAEVEAAKNWNSLNFDSLDIVELVMLIEDKFSIVIDDEESSTLVDISSVVALIESKLKGK